MIQFTVNPQGFGPYKNFQFRGKWDATTGARQFRAISVDDSCRTGWP
jgi:hypothetical protein